MVSSGFLGSWIEDKALEKISCDVLVVGGGGAGLRAALAAHECGCEVVLATRGLLGSSGVTAVACSDRMAFHATLPATEPGGFWNWAHHADDIFRIGGEVSDPSLAEILARESAAAFDYLDQAGVPWSRDEHGIPRQFVTDGSKYARACYTGPYTANDIHAALLAQLHDTRIRAIEHCFVADLVLDPSREEVLGAIAFNEGDFRRMLIQAGSVVLATGGAGAVFARSVYPPGMTGDGYALALRAGAELVNMEFIQLGLCSVATGLACSGSFMRALPRIVDSSGNELLGELQQSSRSEIPALSLLFDKGASWPISVEHPSHRIDLVVARTQARGKKTFLDFTANPALLDGMRLPSSVDKWYKRNTVVRNAHQMNPLARLQAINPESIEWLRNRGVDLVAGDRIEIEPFIQHFQGGIRIRTDSMTSIQGLFAAGECAGGQHGANRPGGSALLDSQVFGALAGSKAAEYAKRGASHGIPHSTTREVFSQCFSPYLSSAIEMALPSLQDVQLSLQAAAGVIRTADGLGAAIDRIEQQKQGRPSFDALAPTQQLEARNAMLVGLSVLRSARLREESRGPHLRFASKDAMEPMPRDSKFSWKMTSSHWRADTSLLDVGWTPIRLPNRRCEMGSSVSVARNVPGGMT